MCRCASAPAPRPCGRNGLVCTRCSPGAPEPGAPTGDSTGCDVARDATASTVRAGGEVLDPQTKAFAVPHLGGRGRPDGVSRAPRRVLDGRRVVTTARTRRRPGAPVGER